MVRADSLEEYDSHLPSGEKAGARHSQDLVRA
jgi:hypothetical protein